MAPYLTTAPGVLQNPTATSQCRYCALAFADQFLTSVGISWTERWRNFGLMWAYVAFNVAGAVFLYYVFRARKSGSRKSWNFGGVVGAAIGNAEAVLHSVLTFNKGTARVNTRNAEIV